MSRTAALLLAFLLVVSAPALSTPLSDHSSPEISASVDDDHDTDGPTTLTPNTTARLTLSEVSAEGRDSVIADVGANVEFETDRLDEYHRQRTFEQRLARTEDADERTDVIADELNRIDERIVELTRDEQSAYLAYERGEISERELLRTLTHVHVEARQLTQTIDFVNRHTQDSRVSEYQVEITKFDSPVRERVADAFSGTGDPIDVHVQSSPEGVVLATIDDGTFYREVYRADQRDRDAAQGQSLDQEAAMERYYPWAWGATGATSADGRENYAGLWRMSVSHPHGNLMVFLDTGTERPFRETQALQISQLPTEEVVNETTADTQLRVERTYPAGPTFVTVSDNDGPPPAGTTILVNGEPVVATDADGDAWFIAPERSTYEISMTVGGTEIVTQVVQVQH